MGGHAFHDLHCPRISAEVYNQVKLQTTAALQKVFYHVVVPTEMPEKDNYGDIDFLVASPVHSPTSTNIDNFDWNGIVLALKHAMHTAHGRRGFLNPDCMYFAICAPGHEDEFWVQVDVKVCFKPELFEWQTFELNYASNSKMIGSMVKPLGLTIDPEGLHVRVEDIEETNFPASMVWVSKDPRDVLKITGLDRRILDAGFETKDEIYEYFAGSWLFNPAHFAARLAQEKYCDRLEDRAPHWTYFVKEWVPKQYPGYKFIGEDVTLNQYSQESSEESTKLHEWYKLTRATVREKVFTMFPRVAAEYYAKRAIHVKEQEEHRLREMITAAIPMDVHGWKDDFPQPRIIIIKHAGEEPSTPDPKPTAAGELTPTTTPFDNAHTEDGRLSNLSHTNYVGMWKKRFEKEDRKAERKREEDEAQAKAEAEMIANREKILKRLSKLNLSLGLVAV
ncbi:hypothetical protein BDU57DRAFT_575663 [Ampelomyces quisqualis]|uniref:Uncharacterized protein n=1 Tax=Ampelomyces quisqualis TaxID=50730 RepID=A0A6A5QNU1_AMPQU|nr:hypothetical protein BDU57DRAFT_575663 [Ampelomyces quisqualis]